MDGFTEQTGIAVNVAFLNKGMIERLRAEGKRSPADLVFTTDISRLHNVVSAGLTQPVPRCQPRAKHPGGLSRPQ
jgi:iron(III) transport system substrate-binding protein